MWRWYWYIQQWKKTWKRRWIKIQIFRNPGQIVKIQDTFCSWRKNTPGRPFKSGIIPNNPGRLFTVVYYSEVLEIERWGTKWVYCEAGPQSVYDMRYGAAEHCHDYCLPCVIRTVWHDFWSWALSYPAPTYDMFSCDMLWVKKEVSLKAESHKHWGTSLSCHTYC